MSGALQAVQRHATSHDLPPQLRVPEEQVGVVAAVYFIAAVVVAIVFVASVVVFELVMYCK